MVPDQWEVNKDHLVISKTLGEGAFGRVMMGILEKDGVKTKVACKMLKGRSSRFVFTSPSIVVWIFCNVHTGDFRLSAGYGRSKIGADNRKRR